MLILVAVLSVLILIFAAGLLAAQEQRPVKPRRASSARTTCHPQTPTRQRPANGSSRMNSASNGRSPSQPHRPFQKIYGPDRIGIVGFHDAGFIIALPAEPYAEWLQERSQRLHTKVGGSGTNITDGLRKAVEMLERAPKGVLRRVWLLTDGYPNRETSRLGDVLLAATRAYINVNTIGFGDAYDEGLLKRIADSTHNGKFVPVRTLRELTEALLKAEQPRNGRRQRHQSETTVFVIDLSPSMIGPMEGKRKVTVVEEAVLRLLHYKRECFS